MLEVNVQKRVPVRSGAGATASGLNAKQVVEKTHHEPWMQILIFTTDQERKHRQTWSLEIAEDLHVRVVAQACDGSGDETFLLRMNGFHTDLFFDPEGERRANLLHNRGRSRILSSLDVAGEMVLARTDVGHGSATGGARAGEFVDRFMKDQHPWGIWPTDKLVRA